MASYVTALASLLALACALLAALGGIPQARRRWRRWRRGIASWGASRSSADALSLRTLVAAMPTAPEARSGHRKEVTPTVLLMGDAGVSLPMLLAHADSHAQAMPLDLAPSSHEAPAFWRWWRLPHLTAIELSPPALVPDGSQDLLWHYAQHALHRTARTDQPALHGVVLCISTALLSAPREVAGPAQRALVRQVSDLPQQLQQRLPLHVLVSGLQDLPGYAQVRQALPPYVRRQTLGWRAPITPAECEWPHAFHTLEATLHALRLGVMERGSSARSRHDIHLFFDTLSSLLPALQPVFEDIQINRHPDLIWHGIYFGAAGPQAAFVRHLFSELLPHSAMWARAMD